MKTIKLSAFLIVMLALSLMSFNSKIEKQKTLTYLEYSWNDTKTKTLHVFVSNAIYYDDWLKNPKELRNKFVSKAAEQSQIKIRSKSIKFKGLRNSREEVEIERFTSLYETKNLEESYGRSVKTYYLNL